MTGCSEAFACEHGARLRGPASLKGLVKLAVAIVLASVLMYMEIWAIQEAPTWSGADAIKPVSETDGSFLDLAGPIAIVH